MHADSVAGPRLTPRQRECLEHLVAGRSRPEIGAAMHLAPDSVAHLIEAVSRAHGTPGTTVLVARVLGERLKRCEGERDDCRAALRAVGERVGDRG